MARRSGQPWRLLPVTTRAGKVRGAKSEHAPTSQPIIKERRLYAGVDILSHLKNGATGWMRWLCTLVDALGSFLGELLDELLRALGLE